jgi:hypothetical protein
MLTMTICFTGESNMTTEAVTGKGPLWLLIEEKILGLGDQDLQESTLEGTIHQVAEDLDSTGYNVSNEAGHMLQLRWALADRIKVGRPLMKDFNDALAALKLADVADPYTATVTLIREVGEAWPKLKGSERKPDVLRIIEKTRLDLLVARAKELSDEEGIRFLIGADVKGGVIIEALGISEDEFGRVNAAVEAERAERARVQALVDEAEGKSDEDKVKALIDNNVAEELIVELAGVGRDTVDKVKKSMEAELAEKQRLAEEEAARKKAEAEGPPVEDIPDDQLLEYIESVREIMEFSDQEKEIRAMCEQSSIPLSIVDIAVTEPAKLDEIEEKAGG